MFDFDIWSLISDVVYKINYVIWVIIICELRLFMNYVVDYSIF